MTQPVDCVVDNRPCLREDRCMGMACVRFAEDSGEALTIAERDAIEMTSQLYNTMMGIIGSTRAGANDRAEMVAHIHNLQRMIMSQAAARAYPKLYRKLGERL